LLFHAVKVVTLVYALWSAFHDDFLTLPRMLQPVIGYATQVRLCALSPTDSSGSWRPWSACRPGPCTTPAYRYHQRMKMTKEEAKRDFCEEEGDP